MTVWNTTVGDFPNVSPAGKSGSTLFFLQQLTVMKNRN
jgi:hypothetical protein